MFLGLSYYYIGHEFIYLLMCWSVISHVASSYSTNMDEVNVTIAGSVCDVQSTNSTHIICVTNAQRQSQETKVRVSVGDGGIARMVRDDPGSGRVRLMFTSTVDLIQGLSLSSGQRRFLLHRRVVVQVHVGGPVSSREGLVRRHHQRPDHPSGHRHPRAENASDQRSSLLSWICNDRQKLF